MHEILPRFLAESDADDRRGIVPLGKKAKKGDGSESGPHELQHHGTNIGHAAAVVTSTVSSGSTSGGSTIHGTTHLASPTCSVIRRDMSFCATSISACWNCTHPIMCCW